MLYKNILTLWPKRSKGKKGTCPSDLAVVLSGRQHPSCYLVKHVSSSLTTFFQHPFAFSVTLTHLHNFNICSLMCSLQINKHTHLATGTYNDFIFYQSLPQHASYLWLTVFKTMIMPCHTTQQNFTFLGLVAAILNWGGDTLQQDAHEPHTSIHSI